MRAVKERWRRWRVTLRKVFRRVVYSRSSTQSIAAGVALGVFVGLTPTVGFQMVIAALLATILGVAFDPDSSWDERRELWRISDYIVRTSNMTQSAVGKAGLWTTVITAAVLLP